MIANERIKKEKDGLDVWPDIARYAKTGFASITEDDMLRLRWYGLYAQKPKDGHFMLRVKIPNGDLTAGQMRAMADVAEKWGRGITDITTRQNFQFHWITVEDLPALFALLDSVGITSSGACGDIARNVTGCPVAGLDPREVFDARRWGTLVHEFFLNNKEYSDLPRKYKLSVSGCRHHCAQPEINCFAATGVLREWPDGRCEEGFHVRVGGGLSTRPYFAQKLNMFIPKDKLVSVAAAVTALYRDFGNRENRKRNRLKFLVADWGIERFEEEVRARLDWTPDSGVEWPEPRHIHADHIGVHAQRQDGYSFLGAAVLTGRLTAEQTYEAARVAEEFGDGTLRTTNQQNLVFPNVPNAKVDLALARLEAARLQVTATPIRRVAVACTGSEFCNLAITETKQLLTQIVNHLESTVDIDEPIRINLNGCPNSCAQHHIGDIGLQGCLVKTGKGEAVDGYDISLGGRLGEDSRFVRPIKRKVPATDVASALERLLGNYQDIKDEDEDFSDFVDRHTNEELAALMETTFAEGVEPAPTG